jgi:hypothetical protein
MKPDVRDAVPDARPVHNQGQNQPEPEAHCLAAASSLLAEKTPLTNQLRRYFAGIKAKRRGSGTPPWIGILMNWI